MASATIADVVQYRRFTAFLMGIWLGASILADVAVTQNFQTVDRFLDKPGDVATSVELNQIGRERERALLRRNAAEENAWIFINWERAEIALGLLVAMVLLFGDNPGKLPVSICLAMLLIVAVQHFYLTPQIVDFGRTVDNLPVTDPQSRRFWMLHGIYTSLELVKLALGFGFAARLTIRRKLDPDYFVREYQTTMAGRSATRG